MRATLAQQAPPETHAELVARARAIAGATVAEVAALAGRAVPPDLKRDKGFIGHLAEWATGAPSRTTAAPDFEQLGVELKTIPLDVTGRPRESTFICTIDLRTIADTDWATSALKRKLRCVLWIPVEVDANKTLAERRFGTPLLWTLGAADERILRDDWEQLVALISRDDLDRVTAHTGRCLQVRPKAANGQERRRVLDRDEVPVQAVPRGFYLRREFTQQIFARPSSR